MKNKLSWAVFFLLFLFQTKVFSQYNKQYYIQFKYKKSSFTLQNPSAYLSARALARRNRQGISIDSLDLPVVPFYIDSIKKHCIKICGCSKWLNGVVIEVNDSTQLNFMLSYPFVKSYKQVRLAEKSLKQSKFEKIESPIVSLNPNYQNIYGWAYDQIHQLHGEDLHEQGYKGNGMQIAVLDGGFIGVESNQAFQNMWNENRILGFQNFVFQKDSVFTDAEHGCNVLSIMGINAPNSYVGSAPEASFYLFETEDNYNENSVEEYYWSMGAEKADSIGADLINSSLGYTEFNGGLNNHHYAIDMNGNTNPSAIAANIAGLKGILVCVAAGNEAQSPWHFISSPADAKNILTMGAVDVNRNHASFSSFGPSADGRIKPDVSTMGANTTVVSSSGYIGWGSGTSFASPLLCGMAACLWQKYPTKTALEIRTAIQQSAHLYNTPNDSLGYGIPDFRVADMLLSGDAISILNKDNKPFLFPNPTSKSCYLFAYSNANQQAYAELYDLKGQLINYKYFTAYQNTFDVYSWDEIKNVEDGIYIISFKINKETYQLKWVKQ